MVERDKPLVSICCITYNHENYIKQTIEGFLMQKTNFPIEIIIHDDASTDNTANIIRHYEKNYPNLFRCIYQKNNQYSKGIMISPTFVWPKAKGKYIAICEGDDYWTNPLKLQKQVDFLEANNNVVAHYHLYSNLFEGKIFIKDYQKKMVSFEIPFIHSLQGTNGGTLSMMARTSAINNEWMLKLSKYYPFGDRILDFLLAIVGPSYYDASLNGAVHRLRSGISKGADWNKIIYYNWADLLKNVISHKSELKLNEDHLKLIKEAIFRLEIGKLIVYDKDYLKALKNLFSNLPFLLRNNKKWKSHYNLRLSLKIAMLDIFKNK